MPTTARQDQALFIAFCDIVGCRPGDITKPGMLKAFFEATKAQQFTALKARVQLLRDAQQAEHDGLPAQTTARQAEINADNVELDALLAMVSL